MKTYYKDSCSGATASIQSHRDGTATLVVSVPGTKRIHRTYKSLNGARSAWYRLCN